MKRYKPLRVASQKLQHIAEVIISLYQISYRLILKIDSTYEKLREPKKIYSETTPRFKNKAATCIHSIINCTQHPFYF